MANQIDCDVFVRRNALKNPISYVQGTDLLPIIMHFLDFEIPSGAVANVFVLKSDQTAVYGTATINGNDVTIDVDDQMFMSVGLALLQVEIVSAGETLVSFAQPVSVEPNLKSGDFPPSETHVMWIDEAIKQAQEAVSDANQALEDAQTAITGANNAAAAANEAAENAEQDVQDYLQQNPVSEAVNDYMTAHPVEVTPEVTNHVMTFSEGSQTGTVVENDYAAYTHTENGDYPLRDLDAQDKIRALAPAIIETASGENILLTDSGEQALQGLNLYGQSTQKSTTGAQLFDCNLIQSTERNGITFTNNGDGSISIEGTATEQAYTAPVTISLQPGTYYVSDNINGDTTQFFVGCRTAGSSDTWTDRYNTVFTVTESDEVRAYVNVQAGKTVDAVIYPMLNAGSTALPWEPYTGSAPSPSPDYPQEIVSKAEDGNVEVEVLGGNLYSEGDKENLTNRYESDFMPWGGKNVAYVYADALSDKSDGEIALFIHYYNRKKERIGGNGVNKTIGTSYTKISGEYRGISGGGTGINVNLADVSFIKLLITIYGTSTAVSIKNIVVTAEENLEFTGYYVPQTLTVSTPNGLPGIPVTYGGNYTDETGQQWVCDEVDFKRDVYVQRIGKVTFDGDAGEYWNKNLPDNADNYLYYINLTDKTSGDVLCDKLRNSATIITTTEIGIFGNNVGYPSTVYINFGTAIGDNNVNSFKSYLQSHPITVLYQLATSVETPLSQEELAAYSALHTNYPTTTVINDEGVYMALNYAADTETYIANNYVDKATYNALEDRVAALEGTAVANV